MADEPTKDREANVPPTHVRRDEAAQKSPSKKPDVILPPAAMMGEASIPAGHDEAREERFKRIHAGRDNGSSPVVADKPVILPGSMFVQPLPVAPDREASTPVDPRDVAAEKLVQGSSWGKAIQEGMKTPVVAEVDPAAHIKSAQHTGNSHENEDRFTVHVGKLGDPKGVLESLTAAAVDATKGAAFQSVGCTMTGVLVTEDKKLHFSNLGDSPVLLVIYNPATETTSVVQMTKDQDPNDPETCKKLQANGANVQNQGGSDYSDWRVVGRDESGQERFCGVAAACGDNGFPGMLRTPDVGGPVDLDVLQKAGNHVFVVPVSDGVSKVDPTMRAYEDAIRDAIKKDGVNTDVAGVIVGKAKEMWQGHSHQDDVTAVAFRVPEGKMAGSVLMSVADGHGGHQAADVAISTVKQKAEALMPDIPKVAAPVAKAEGPKEKPAVIKPSRAIPVGGGPS